MRRFLMSTALVAAMVLGACGDDSGGGSNTNENTNTNMNANENTNTNTNTNTNGNTADIGNYAGSGAHGDLVTFTIHRGDSTYEVHNETTGLDESGSYTVMSELLSGVYEISKGSDKFFAVELNDKILAANFPTGNPDNTISFGVSEDATPSMSDVVGDYVYIAISNGEVNGSPDIKEWGLLNLEGDGTFRVKSFATAPGDGSDYPDMAPEAITNPFPISDPDMQGDWVLDQDNPPALNVVDGDGAVLFAGYVYADPQQAAFVLDLGEGNGFLIAFHLYDVASVADVAGDYKFINVWNDANMTGRSAGVLQISPSGEGFFSHIDVDGNISTGTVDGLTQCPDLPNMFYFDSTETGHGATVHERFYFVIMQEMALAFGFNTDNGEFVFTSYAAGAKL